MFLKKPWPWLLTLLFLSFPAVSNLQRLTLLDSLKIADVWSGHPVDFSFVARGDSQYVAYYDSAQRMTVAMHDVGSNMVHKKTLPSTVGWDSHNYIAMALDSAGYFHVSGNMHSSALVYFRSTAPYSIDSLKAASMVGSEETSVTYPVFYYGPSGELIFMYRTGSSGNGNQIFNNWSITTKKWSRLFDKPLFDGEGQRNAYMGGPVSGPDGYYYVYWMWRETADASTTHDVGCIRSKDLLQWETISGTKLTIPITLSTKGVLVETIPQHGGVINRGAVGFDKQKRPIVTYHKFDANGNTQLYNARWEDNAWNIHQVTDWAYRWDFGGTGTLVLEVTFGPVVLEQSGSLTQVFYHKKYGSGIMELDEATLKKKSDLGSSLWPEALEQPRQSGMVVHWLKDQGVITLAGSFFNSTSTPRRDPSVVYALRWETMPENKDQPRTPVPAATPLMLYKFKDPNAGTVILSGSDDAQGNLSVQVIRGTVVKNYVRLRLPQQTRGAVSVRINNVQGKEVANYTVSNPGNSSIILNTNKLRSGYYLIVMQAGAKIWRSFIMLIN
jgi:hypothetical protein